MKPITYWVQNDAINALVHQYGPHLERLSVDDRRSIIAVLAVPSLDGVIELGDEAADEDFFDLIETLSDRERDLLIEAIAATLTHHGNPWLENARANVALEQAQKTGTPSP